MQLRKHSGVFTNREVAEKIGIYPEALNRLKKMGIVPQPTRNVVGLTRRYYSEQDVERIVEMLGKGSDSE